ncbi:PLP-dependent aminotransferase family protein [uncultured Paracoccus sp.]|uniref:MocR-like pyridoxine biosynthesis transcription factor PdxR n=1 Tax=uncultured Paracoccus sp. TaxID=189685 RepID=UPI00262EFFB1|nr:PLP-dependent aminotransferase family protein [uncultured Paracoccus sp.]
MEHGISPDSIFLNESLGVTLQGRLSAALVRLILDRRYAPGTKLPSSRELARHLGISRLTVTLVYQELVAQGYIEARPRSGFVVAETVPHRRIQPQSNPEGRSCVSWSDWLAQAPQRRRVIHKPADWRNYRYPFIYGQADPSLFDLSAWRECVRQATARHDFSELAADQYGQDDPLLVDFICANTLPRRGISAQPENVLITLGAQNALYMAVELLAAPDRLTVMEEPGYPDFAEILRRARCPVHFQRIRAQGLDPADLPPEARLVMVTPSHNIPTGITMPLVNRRELLRLATERDFLIIEDDYEFEMSYLAPPEPSLKSLDQDGRVIYVGSFSKSLFPGLRIGYMVGPAPLIARARELRAVMLRHPPGHLQRITAYFLAYGHYDAHIVKLRRIFAERRATLVKALQDVAHLTIAGAARQGGSSIWIRGHEGLDSDKLSRELRAESVLIEAGAAFFETPRLPCPFFRLGYSSITETNIATGVELIGRAAARLR